jgi:hypothetical protein
MKQFFWQADGRVVIQEVLCFVELEGSSCLQQTDPTDVIYS